MNRAVLATGGVLAATSGLFIVLAHHRRAAQLRGIVPTRNLGPVQLQAVRETAEAIRASEFEQRHGEDMKQIWRAALLELENNVNQEDEPVKWASVVDWVRCSSSPNFYPHNFWEIVVKRPTNIPEFKTYVEAYIADRLS
jgi:hypothetical protein